MKKKIKTPLATAMGAAVISTIAATAAQAEANLFGMTELAGGYMQLAENDKAGEMACGASMGMPAQNKTPEGACAGSVKKSADKAAEAKCGENQCGAMMKDGKMKPGMEHSCGAMMKGKDGACGNMGKSEAGSNDQTTVSPKEAAGK